MAKRKSTGNHTPKRANKHEDLFWDFAFDQVTALTNHLLEVQVLRLDQILHVIHAFAYSTRLAGYEQSLDRPELASTLVDCATDLILDYCNSYRAA